MEFHWDDASEKIQGEDPNVFVKVHLGEMYGGYRIFLKAGQRTFGFQTAEEVYDDQTYIDGNVTVWVLDILLCPINILNRETRKKEDLTNKRSFLDLEEQEEILSLLASALSKYDGSVGEIQGPSRLEFTDNAKARIAAGKYLASFSI